MQASRAHQSRRQPRRPPKSRRGVRLTQRGRLVVRALLAGAAAAGLVLAFAVGPAVTASPRGSHERAEVVVRRGETLWSVATRHDPSQDPLVTIEEIRELNDLSGYTVHPGQTLQLP